MALQEQETISGEELMAALTVNAALGLPEDPDKAYEKAQAHFDFLALPLMPEGVQPTTEAKLKLGEAALEAARWELRAQNAYESEQRIYSLVEKLAGRVASVSSLDGTSLIKEGGLWGSDREELQFPVLEVTGQIRHPYGVDSFTSGLIMLYDLGRNRLGFKRQKLYGVDLLNDRGEPKAKLTIHPSIRRGWGGRGRV